IESPPIQPLPPAAVLGLADAIGERLRRLVLRAAGTGMRQGECFGLTIDRVDLAHGTVIVDRQLIQLSGELPYVAPPKTPAAYRTIPLPRVVTAAISEQVEEFGTGVTVDAVGRTIEGIVFTRHDGSPIRRGAFNGRWRHAVKR